MRLVVDISKLYGGSEHVNANTSMSIEGKEQEGFIRPQGGPRDMTQEGKIHDDTVLLAESILISLKTVKQLNMDSLLTVICAVCWLTSWES